MLLVFEKSVLLYVPTIAEDGCALGRLLY